MQLKKLSSTLDLMPSSGVLRVHPATQISMIHVTPHALSSDKGENSPKAAAEDGNFSCLSDYMLYLEQFAHQNKMSSSCLTNPEEI
jgi:hypothetical protein